MATMANPSSQNGGIRCPYCQGLTPIIDRYDHTRFYDCPLCKGKKYLSKQEIFKMAELTANMDMRKVMKRFVTLNVKVKNTGRVLARLKGLVWFLKFLAWMGGVKEVVIEFEHDEPANEPMEQDIKEWFRDL